MPNIRSAAKRDRQTKARTARNRAARSRIRTERRRIAELVEKGDAAGAQAALTLYFAIVDKAAKTSVMHRKTADRLKSRAALSLAAKAGAGA